MNEKLSGFLTRKFRISAVETNAYYLRTSTYPLSMQSFLKDPRRPPIPPFFMAVSWRWGGEEKKWKVWFESCNTYSCARWRNCNQFHVMTTMLMESNSGLLESEGLGGTSPLPLPPPQPPQFSADQITLSQSGGADYAHRITTCLSDFQTFLRHWWFHHECCPWATFSIISWGLERYCFTQS